MAVGQKMMKQVLACSISVALAFSPLVSHACTAVNVIAKDGSVVAGRTMEWAFDMKWELIANPKGSPIQLSAPKSMNLPATTLTSKYAFVGVAQASCKAQPPF